MQLFVGAVSFGAYYLLGRQAPNEESKKNDASLSTAYTVVSAGAMKLESGRLCSTVNDHHATFSEFTHSEEVSSQRSVSKRNKAVYEGTGAAGKIKSQGDTSESTSKKVESHTTASQKPIAPALAIDVKQKQTQILGGVTEQGSLTDNLQSASSKIERKVEENTSLNAQLIKQGIADASIPIGVVLASIATGGTSALPTLCYSFCVATGAGVVIELLVPKNAVSLKELLKLIATFATLGLTPSKNTISEFCNATVLHFVGRSYRYVVNKMCDSIGIAKSSWTRTIAECFSGFIVPLAAQGIANSYQQLQKKSTPTPLPIIPSQNPDFVGSYNLQKAGTLPLLEGKLPSEFPNVNAEHFCYQTGTLECYFSPITSDCFSEETLECTTPDCIDEGINSPLEGEFSGESPKVNSEDFSSQTGTLDSITPDCFREVAESKMLIDLDTYPAYENGVRVDKRVFYLKRTHEYTPSANKAYECTVDELNEIENWPTGMTDAELSNAIRTVMKKYE